MAQAQTLEQTSAPQQVDVHHHVVIVGGGTGLSGVGFLGR